VTNPRETSSVTVPLANHDCFSYLPGHRPHHIAVLRVHLDTPRDPVTVLDANADGWITFRDQESRDFRWWNHDAPRSVALWCAGALFARVRDSHFLVARWTDGSETCICCNEAPSPCVSRPSADPIEALKNEGGCVMAVKDRAPS